MRVAMIVFIEKVYVDNSQILFVKPKSYSFDKIYRSAMGVNWDENKRCLYQAHPSREWDILRWYKQILLAVKSEYGITLKICSDTIYENIEPEVQKSIEKDQL